MFLTFLEAKKIVAQYAGRGGLSHTSPEVAKFLVKVMQYMLYAGQYGNKKKFCFHAVKGCFTVPYELEAPIELRVDNHVGKVWNKWFEWNDSTPLNDCIPATNALYEDPNYYPIAYDVPAVGARIGTMGTCNEESDAHIIVQGKDLSGREVFTVHKGDKIAGEYLSIKRDVITFTTVTFAQVTNVTKTKTNGYVQLIYIEPNSQNRGFLSEYSPLEINPSYRRFTLTSPCSTIAKVTVLGKIRIKQEYSDNDRIPFDNMVNIETAAKALHSLQSNNVDQAAALDAALQTNIERENNYKQIVSSNPIRYSRATSPGRIRNIR